MAYDDKWVGLLAILCGVHIVVALVLASPFLFFGRKRVKWKLVDCLGLVCPIGFWFVLTLLKPVAKNDLDSIFEPFMISVAVAMAALARVVVGRKVPENTVSIFLTGLLCVAAVIIYFCDPTTHDSM
jgi:peptidoglycan/LPS O-acetylase OafA/YrhL